MRRGDREEAFTTFVAARQSHLRRVAYALCGDWHKAEDLLQTSLTKLYVAWPRIEHVGNEEAYVRQIMVRANIDEFRRPWRRERPTDDVGDSAAAPGLAYEERSALLDALHACPSSSARWSCCGTGSACRCERRPARSASPRAPSRATATAGSPRSRAP